METKNHDICGLIRRVDRFSQELHKSVSSGTSKTNEFDKARLQTYLIAITSYMDWVIGQPQLDLPESSPQTFAVLEDAGLADVENEDMNDLLRLIRSFRIELVNCQSSRDPAGLNKFDDARCRALVAKMQAFLDTYIDKVSPLDLPESSPLEASSGPGRTGV